MDFGIKVLFSSFSKALSQIIKWIKRDGKPPPTMRPHCCLETTIYEKRRRRKKRWNRRRSSSDGVGGQDMPSVESWTILSLDRFGKRSIVATDLDSKSASDAPLRTTGAYSTLFWGGTLTSRQRDGGNRHQVAGQVHRSASGY